MVRRSGVLLALVLATIPVVARAQDDLRGPDGQSVVAPSPDERRDLVRLHDGGVVRGVVVLWRPGARVVIRTPDGFEHEFMADEIETVDIARDPSEASLLPMPEPGPTEARSLGDPDDLDPTSPVDARMMGRTWHLGLQLGFGYHFIEHPWIPSAGFAELGAVLELRALPELHVRLAAFFWVDELDGSYAEQTDMDTMSLHTTEVHAGGVGARGRVLVGYDITRHIAVRLGGELGFVSINRLMWVGGASLEIAYRIVRGFEVSIAGGPSVRPGWEKLVEIPTVGAAIPEEVEDYAVGVRLGVQLAYMF